MYLSPPGYNLHLTLNQKKWNQAKSQGEEGKKPSHSAGNIKLQDDLNGDWATFLINHANISLITNKKTFCRVTYARVKQARCIFFLINDEGFHRRCDTGEKFNIIV